MRERYEDKVAREERRHKEWNDDKESQRRWSDIPESVREREMSGDIVIPEPKEQR